MAFPQCLELTAQLTEAAGFLPGQGGLVADAIREGQGIGFAGDFGVQRSNFVFLGTREPR